MKSETLLLILPWFLVSMGFVAPSWSWMVFIGLLWELLASKVWIDLQEKLNEQKTYIS